MLVTGARGMVGRALVQHCETLGDEVVARDHRTLDISDLGRVLQTIRDEQPEAVINCAAWTDVDGCESDRDRAFAANSSGPENLAKACGEVGATLVTISTDYVFDGDKTGFYTQEDAPNPRSVYGWSKLEGERRAQSALDGAIVARTGFVFGAGGRNFLSTIVDRARQGAEIKAISDCYGTPTYAWDLGVRLRELAVRKHAGVFHVVNAGDGLSFAEFARAALDLAGMSAVEIEGVTMDSLQRPAPRPRNSRLKCLTSEALGLPPMPFWKDSLRDFVGLLSTPAGSAEAKARA